MSPKAPSPIDAARWTRTGRLAALAMLLSYLETFVPIPIPGIRLGLANIPILIALWAGDTSSAANVAAIKVLASGLLFGSPLTLAYSAVGTALSLSAMVALSHLKTMRLEMTSVIGAMLHVVGQLLVAQLLLGTGVVWYASPVLLAAGCASGALSGWLTQRVVLGINPCADRSEPEVPIAAPTPQRPRPGLAIGCIAWIGFVVVVLHAQDLRILGSLCLAALTLCPAARVQAREFLAAIRPMAVIAVMSVAMQAVVHGPNMGAFNEAARSVLRLAAIASSSVALGRLVPTNNLAGTVAWLVSPLAGFGIDTAGFSLAFLVAIETMPELARAAKDRIGAHGGRLSPKELVGLLPDLARDLLNTPS